MQINDVIYNLPQDLELQAKVIELIPDGWAFMRGSLHATRQHHLEDKVSKNTMLVFGDNVSTGVKIIQTSNEQGLPYEDLQNRFLHYSFCNSGYGPMSSDLLLKGKLASSIGFSHAGAGHSGPIYMPDVKEIIAHYIQAGYKGTIEAISRYDEEGDALSALVISHWSNLVSVGWDHSRNYRNDREEFDTLVRELNKLGLEKKEIGVLV